MSEEKLTNNPENKELSTDELENVAGGAELFDGDEYRTKYDIDLDKAYKEAPINIRLQYERNKIQR